MRRRCISIYWQQFNGHIIEHYVDKLHPDRQCHPGGWYRLGDRHCRRRQRQHDRHFCFSEGVRALQHNRHRQRVGRQFDDLAIRQLDVERQRRCLFVHH